MIHSCVVKKLTEYGFTLTKQPIWSQDGPHDSQGDWDEEYVGAKCGEQFNEIELLHFYEEIKRREAQARLEKLLAKPDVIPATFGEFLDNIESEKEQPRDSEA